MYRECMNKLGKIVYIGGYGRSGSTILSLVLGQLEGVSSIGEIGALTRAIQEHRNCTCGSALVECVFWGEFLGSKRCFSSDKESLLADSALSFAFNKSQARYLVDSTKTSYKNFSRPYNLRKRGFEIYFIHLVRDLTDVIKSAKKGANSALEQGSAERKKLVVLRTILSWSAANIFAFGYKYLFKSKYIYVQYNSMVENPESFFNMIGEFLDIDMAEVISKIDAGAPLSVSHEINGNRLLRSGPIVFKKGT